MKLEVIETMYNYLGEKQAELNYTFDLPQKENFFTLNFGTDFMVKVNKDNSVTVNLLRMVSKEKAEIYNTANLNLELNTATIEEQTPRSSLTLNFKLVK